MKDDIWFRTYAKCLEKCLNSTNNQAWKSIEDNITKSVRKSKDQNVSCDDQDRAAHTDSSLGGVWEAKVCMEDLVLTDNKQELITDGV